MSNPPSWGVEARTKSRRHFLLELAGVAAIVAVPVGVGVATARPIANPPSRDELDVLSEERKALIEQRSSESGGSSDNSDWKKAREERKKSRDARKQPKGDDGAGN